VTDAGDAVSGATVRIGTRRLLTNARGEVSVHLPAGTHRAEAAKAGYAPAVADVTEGTRAGAN
jgi:hypothetical protein